MLYKWFVFSSQKRHDLIRNEAMHVGLKIRLFFLNTLLLTMKINIRMLSEHLFMLKGNDTYNRNLETRFSPYSPDYTTGGHAKGEGKRKCKGKFFQKLWKALSIKCFYLKIFYYIKGLWLFIIRMIPKHNYTMFCQSFSMLLITNLVLLYLF